MRSTAGWIRTLALAAGVAVLCVGCATSEVKPARASAPAASTGFLADYSLLQADPADPGYRHYVAPAFNPAQYRKFIVDTPEVLVNTGDGYQALDPAKVNAMADYYRAAMTAALSAHYQVVDAPGPGVARLRVAVVAATEAMPALKARDLVPVSALFKLGRMAVGKNPLVLRMSIEGEMLDAQTGTLLGETVDSRESTKTVTNGNVASDEQLHDVISFWVKRFVARLDKANGFTP